MSIVIFAGIIAYMGSFSADFQFDDYHVIVNNPVIKHFSPKNIWEYDKSRFLTNITFALNYFFFRLKVAWWHMFNLFVHIASACCAYFLTYAILQSERLKSSWSLGDAKRVSFFVSLIFLLHPIQTESVTYIVQRSTLLAGCCYLCAAYFYVRSRNEPRLIYYFWMFLFCALGTFSKPTIVTLFAVLMIHDLLFVKSRPKNLAAWGISILFLFLPIIIVPFVLFGPQALAELIGNSQKIFSPMQYLFTQFNVVITYIRLLFFPINQNLDYDYNIARTLLEFPTFFSFAAIILIVTLFIKLAKKYPIISFGVFWFFITISPTTSFFPLPDVIFEHRLYLGCYGFALFLTVSLYRILRQRKWFYTAMCCVVISFAILTYQRNSIWANPLLCASDVVLKSPDKARPHNNLGFFYFRQGDYPKARQEYKKAIAVDPEYMLSAKNLAMVYLIENNLSEAHKIFSDITKKYPDRSEGYVGLAHVYEKQGKNKEAMKFLKKAEGFRIPERHDILKGNIYNNLGEAALAKSEFHKAIWFNPDSAIAHYNLGNVYLNQDELSLAFFYYSKAIELKPDFVEAIHNVGNVFFLLGENDRAIHYYKKVFEYDPDLADAHFNLANVLHSSGNVKEARKYAKTASELYRKQGRIDKAKTIEDKLLTGNEKE